MTALAEGCARMVVGYAVKDEFIRRCLPGGHRERRLRFAQRPERPVFLRTVKLKDYPWNGKLHLGVRERSAGAWNPVAGFTDRWGG